MAAKGVASVPWVKPSSAKHILQIAFSKYFFLFQQKWRLTHVNCLLGRWVTWNVTSNLHWIHSQHLKLIVFWGTIPGSNFLLPTVWPGSKLNFHVANLLLATVNFEPCNCLTEESVGYSLDIMRQTACLVVNPIIVDGYASLFTRRQFRPQIQWWPLRKTLTSGLGLDDMSLAWPAVLQLLVFI